MWKLFTIGAFSLLVSSTVSAEYDPKGCKKKGCDEYEWYNKGRFNPLTIHWPLHYTGDTYLDRKDGGQHDIIVTHGHHNSYHWTPLWDFRRHPDCPSPTYLSEGVRMHDAFECDYHPTDKPTWKTSTCSDIYSSYEDKIIDFDGESCRKVIRQWVIVDWCEYKPNGVANTKRDKYVLVKESYSHKSYFTYGRDKWDYERDGWYTFDQVIKIIDKDAPKMVSCDDVVVELKNGKCETPVKVINRIKDTGPCVGDKMTVEAFVKNARGDLIDQEWIHARHDQDFSLLLGTLSEGSYTIHWKYKDGCGNRGDCYQKVKVVDKSAPALLCIKNVSISVSDAYGSAIWADDFALKFAKSCSDEEISLSFAEDEIVSSLKFTCDDDLGIQDLMVYATDANGNTSSCEVELFVADNANCRDEMLLVGKVFDRNYAPLEDVQVDVMKGETLISKGMSDSRGRYQLHDVPNLKTQAVLMPSKEDHTTDDLDVNDLLLLLRHLTRVEAFDDILEYGAADVNSDGKLDLNDYWELTNVVFGTGERSADFKPWKFFDVNQYESRAIRRASRLIVPIPVYHFVQRYDIMGIKTGDLDFSSLQTNKAKWRSPSSYSGSFKLAESAIGNSYQFSTEGLSDIHHMTIEFDGISRSDILKVNLDESINHVISESENGCAIYLLAPMGLVGSVAVTLSADSKATLNNVSTAHEVDNEGGIPATIQWIQGATSLIEQEGMAVSPNPFTDQLQISFYAQSTESAEVSVISMSGQRIMTQAASIHPGKNIVTIDAGDVQSGVYLLQLTSPTLRKTVRISKARP